MVAVPKPQRYPKERFFKPARSIKNSCPLEEDEQYAVVQWLELHGIMFQASSMGLFMPLPTRMKFKKMGCKAGSPDIFIYDRPRIVENGLIYVGCCIELKRESNGVLSDLQKQWLVDLHDRGWASYCVKGADSAIRLLEFLYLGKGLNPCPNEKILQAKDLVI